MKRIAWIAMLSVAALIAAGCTKVETENTPDPTSDTQPVDAGPAEPPAGSETAQEPPGDDGQPEDEQRVPGAIGKALLKGIAGGSESDKDEPGEAPEYKP